MRHLHHYRTKTEYTAESLNTALDGEQKERIMLRVCPSNKQLEQMLDELLHVELLMYNQYTKTYHTTNMGKCFLEMYHELLKSGIYGK